MPLKIRVKLLQASAYLVVLSAVAVGVWLARDQWLPLIGGQTVQEQIAEDDSAPLTQPKTLKLSQQARANLGLMSKLVRPQTYWRTIQIPGVIVDRPGVTDRGITSPIGGVVTVVHAFQGDIIRPREKLFTLRLVSEYLQNSQADLFKAIRETEITTQEMERLGTLADSGVIPTKRIIELEQQLKRQSALIDAARQDLLSRGLTAEQLLQIEGGKFLTTIDVFAPKISETAEGLDSDSAGIGGQETGFFEIQELTVDLGQQVDAGQALAVLANHSSLYVEGHAFKKEASNLARAAENQWPVGVEFTEEKTTDWPTLDQVFQIRHLSNTTDPSTRTIDFFIPLANQSRQYHTDGRLFLVWRYRPGQRVRIAVPVEQLEGVIVVPAAAVTFEGPEAYVFQQNGDLFNRIAVQVVHQDQSNVVLADDGSILPGFYLAQGSAASLNRVLKAQASSGMRADVHVHADGTTHAAH